MRSPLLSAATLLLLTALSGCQPGTTGPGTDTDTDTDTDTSPPVLTPKALLIFIDGFIPQGLDTAEVPTMDTLQEHAAWSREGRAESTTISGSGWSSFLTGVHWDKHNVPNNSFTDPNYTDYPHIFARLKEARPEAVTAGCQSWSYIESGLVIPAAPDHSSYHDYDSYSNDYWDEASPDRYCTEDVVGYAGIEAVDLLVVMYADLDGIGHDEGYGAEYASYQTYLSTLDGYIGEVIDAIEARPTYAEESWLVILSTDHAGTPDLHHGYNIPEHRLIPFIVSGPAVSPGEIWPRPQTVDIVPTALHHLGVEVQPEWELDGVVVGFEPTARPSAVLDENLLFNGDAEYERGYVGYTDVPDTWSAGWWDPGYLTTILWDSPGGYPLSSEPGPSDRGNNLFAGGWTSYDTLMKQEIDLSPLTATLASGASYTLSAWLGGYASQDDSVSLTVNFMGSSGDTLATETIGPVLAADRGEATGLLFREATGEVPSAAVKAVVTLKASVASGYNDGYADNLSLIIGESDTTD